MLHIKDKDTKYSLKDTRHFERKKLNILQELRIFLKCVSRRNLSPQTDE